MKISKKISFLAVTFAMGISFLAGCNNNNPKPQPSGGDSETTSHEEGSSHDESVHEHTYSELIAEVPATCTEPGMKAHYTCTGCEKLFDADKREVTAEQLVIAALGHQMIPHAQVDPQCEVAGQEAYFECSRCHKLFSDEQGEHEIQAAAPIEATGHVHLTAHPRVEPSCTETGTEAYWSCDDCHKLFSDANAEHEIAEPVSIAALDHDYSTEWTQGEDTHYHVCSRCGAKKDEAAHSADDWAIDTEPTYETDGVEVGHCLCGKVLTRAVAKKTAENVYNFASRGNPNRPGSPENDEWNWGTVEGISVVNFGEGGYAFKFSMTADDAITEAYYQTIDQTSKLEEDKVVTIQVKNGTDKELKMTVKNRSWNFSGEAFTVASGATQQITIGALIYNKESENPAQNILGGFAIQFLSTDSSVFVGDLLITAPTQPVACPHSSLAHREGVPANPYENRTGTLDHYYCPHCGKLWADEAKTIELQESQLEVPATFAINPNWSWNAIPVYDAQRGILYRSPATFNDTSNPDVAHYCAIESAAKEITDGRVKSITFKFMNGTNQKLTFEIRSRAWNIWYDTLELQPGEWRQYTYTRAQWNADPSGTNYGFALRILRDKSLSELPTGYIYNAMPEFDSYTDAEIAKLDSDLENVGVTDGIDDETYIWSFLDSKKVIDKVYGVFGENLPDNFVNQLNYYKYLAYYETNKVLFDANQTVSRWGYGDENVTNIESQIIADVPYNKLTLANATNLRDGFAVCTPRTADSALIRNATYFILRIYNPTNARVSLRIHGGWNDWNAYVTNLTPLSWNTIIVNTTNYVNGDYFGLQFINADADLSGEWLISSIVHYTYRSKIVWGFNDSENMTVSPSWGASTITGKDGRAVYKPVMSEGTSTLTAMECVTPLDANVYDRVEFCVYNDTGVTLSMSTRGENGSGTNYNLGIAGNGTWTKVIMTIEEWNDMGILSNGKYTRYITYSADETFSGDVYVTAFYAIAK